MKKLYFPTEQEFLNELDGQVYAISDNKGHYVCDILEKDYLDLVYDGEVVNLDESSLFEGLKSFSQYVLVWDKNDVQLARFKDDYGVQIVIMDAGKGYTLKNAIKLMGELAIILLPYEVTIATNVSSYKHAGEPCRAMDLWLHYTTSDGKREHVNFAIWQDFYEDDVNIQCKALLEFVKAYYDVPQSWENKFNKYIKSF